jgi:hypothetical protein
MVTAPAALPARSKRTRLDNPVDPVRLILSLTFLELLCAKAGRFRQVLEISTTSTGEIGGRRMAGDGTDERQMSGTPWFKKGRWRARERAALPREPMLGCCAAIAASSDRRLLIDVLGIEPTDPTAGSCHCKLLMSQFVTDKSLSLGFDSLRTDRIIIRIIGALKEWLR